jgi:hypothetical protein
MSERAELYKALLAAQQEMPAIHKGATATVPTKAGGSFSYSYAALPDLLAAVLPVLNKHGLVLWQAPVNLGAGPPILRTVLAHAESGEELVAEFALVVAQPGMQAIGSAITYGRRYAVVSMLGLAPDEDDDGAAASRQPDPKPQEKPADDGGLPGYEEPKATAKQTKEFLEVAQGLLDGGAVTEKALETAMGFAPFPAGAKKMSGPKTVDLTERLIRHRDHLLAEQAAEAAAKDA